MVVAPGRQQGPRRALAGTGSSSWILSGYAVRGVLPPPSAPAAPPAFPSPPAPPSSSSRPQFFKGNFQDPVFFSLVPLQAAVEREIARFYWVNRVGGQGGRAGGQASGGWAGGRVGAGSAAAAGARPTHSAARFEAGPPSPCSLLKLPPLHVLRDAPRSRRAARRSSAPPRPRRPAAPPSRSAGA